MCDWPSGNLKGEKSVIASADGNFNMGLSSVSQEPSSRAEHISDCAITNIRHFIPTKVGGCNDGCMYFFLLFLSSLVSPFYRVVS